MENHIGMIDKKVDGLTDHVKELASVLGKVLNKIEERFEAIDKRFEAMDKRFDVIEKRLDGMDERFEAMDKKIDDLRGDSKHTIATLEQGFYEVKVEIKKIAMVTGYEGMYENTVGLGV